MLSNSKTMLIRRNAHFALPNDSGRVLGTIPVACYRRLGWQPGSARPILALKLSHIVQLKNNVICRSLLVPDIGVSLILAISTTLMRFLSFQTPSWVFGGYGVDACRARRFSVTPPHQFLTHHEWTVTRISERNMTQKTFELCGALIMGFARVMVKL